MVTSPSPSILPRLVKLLELSSSDFDAEALSAIRKANNLLAANDMRWAQFFDALGANISVEAPSTNGHQVAEPEALFATIEERTDTLSDSQQKWFPRLRAAYRRTGRLSPRQLGVLQDIAAAVAP